MSDIADRLRSYINGDTSPMTARERNSLAEIESLRTQLADATRKLEEARKDAERLEWLVSNECKVWEVNGRYSVHDVTEHHAITKEFPTSRQAIDRAIEQSKGGNGE